MRFDSLVTDEVRQRMVEIARDLRRKQQPSEALFWDALRNRKLGGFKFRR
jgi:very-short-patch-repair endonuclease